MLHIRADLLVRNTPYSITRQAFEQYRALKNADRAKPLSDSKLLDKLGHVLESTHPDHSKDPESYEIDGVKYPLFYRVSSQNAYHLAIVGARYQTLVGIQSFTPPDDVRDVIVHEVDFHGEVLGVTDHALERFVQRWIQYEKDVPLDPLKTLKRILNKAEPDELSSALRVLRLINNGYVPTLYLRFGPWRMIVVDEESGKATKVLVTFERRIRT
jgi:hypothetical protein